MCVVCGRVCVYACVCVCVRAATEATLEEAPAAAVRGAGRRKKCVDCFAKGLFRVFEAAFIHAQANRIQPFFDRDMKRRQFEGESWKKITEEIIAALPAYVFISFDIDGLDPKLCPNTGTPVPGGLELEQVFYLFQKLHHAGKKIIGFDLNEVGVSSNEWDENVGARALYKLCNLLAASHTTNG